MSYHMTPAEFIKTIPPVLYHFGTKPTDLRDPRQISNSSNDNTDDWSAEDPQINWDAPFTTDDEYEFKSAAHFYFFMMRSLKVFGVLRIAVCKMTQKIGQYHFMDEHYDRSKDRHPINPPMPVEWYEQHAHEVLSGNLPSFPFMVKYWNERFRTSEKENKFDYFTENFESFKDTPVVIEPSFSPFGNGPPMKKFHEKTSSDEEKKVSPGHTDRPVLRLPAQTTTQGWSMDPAITPSDESVMKEIMEKFLKLSPQNQSKLHSKLSVLMM